MWIGVFGGFWGIVNLFWPSYVYHGAYFDLFSRLADSFLYVPFAVISILAIDDRLVWGKQVRRTLLQRFASAEKRERHKQAKEGRDKLRFFLSAFLVFLMGAVALPFVADGIRGARLCFHEEDIAAAPLACMEGARAMQQTDSSTKSFYRLCVALTFIAM